MPNYFQIGPAVFDKMNSAWNGNLLATLKGDHRRIIPVKSGEIPPSG